MYKDRTILGIIPARGGSKGLPGKNILNIAGKPLIAWTIERAVSSGLLDRAIVSTDNQEIADTAKKHGAEVPFLRPGDIAGDTTPMIDVAVHAIDFYKNKNIVFDYIALLEPTSPLRKENDIDDAVKALIDRETEADGLVSVGEVHLEHPSVMKNINGKYVKPYEADAGTVSRRQDLDKVYFPYGVIYLVKTNMLVEHRTFYQERTIPFYIERWQNYEVDDIYDFMCIETIIKNKLKESDK